MSHFWYETELEPREEVAALYDKTPLEDWGLTPRARRILLRANYLTLGDLLRAGSGLWFVSGFGTAIRIELNEKIRRVLKLHQIDLDDLPLDFQNTLPSTYVNNRPTGYFTKIIKKKVNNEPYWYEIDWANRKKLAIKFANVPITSWGLDNRTYNALRRGNYKTVGDVLRADQNFYQNISNFGPKLLKVVNDKVLALLQELETDPAVWPFPTPGKFDQNKPTSVSTSWIDWLGQLPARITGAPLSWLLLGGVARQLMTNSGLVTVGDLINHVVSVGGPDARDNKALADPVAVAGGKALVRFLSFFDEAEMEDISWEKYWEGMGITVLPRNFEPGASLPQIIKGLTGLIKELVEIPARGGQSRERVWSIIERRFSLEKPGKMTFKELAKAFNLTSQRIIQIKLKSLERLELALIEGEVIEKCYLVHPEVQATVKALTHPANIAPGQAVLESNLLGQIRGSTGLNPDKHRPLLGLLFTLISLHRVELIDNLEPVWGNISSTRRKWLEKWLEWLDDFLTHEKALPQAEIDILVWLNKGLGEAEKISLRQLKELAQLCSSIEQLPDGTYQGKFAHLKGRGNQVERILYEKNQQLSMPEIAREINRRLTPTGQLLAKPRNITNQLAGDKRFVPVGNTGRWALSAWPQIDTNSIYELMEKGLREHNQPMTPDELYAYVSTRRAASKNTIRFYLNDKTRFTRVALNQWALAGWKMAAYKGERDKARKAEILENIFKKSRQTELPYSDVIKALMETAGISDSYAYNFLNNNPAVVIARDPNGQRRMVSLVK